MAYSVNSSRDLGIDEGSRGNTCIALIAISGVA
ncbi:MAG: hypothetical protein K1000chlam4_01032, partial [Chlamydiae bacterium]|nr:hypothetical protein [Chlamydiota bacterium]